jgi:hypothetical protein
MDDHFWLKLAISTGAVLVIVARVIWPDLKVDAITLGLLVVAILPWLSVLIESAKFPGGWEVKFRNVQRAGEKIIGGAPSGVASIEPPPAPSYLQIVEQDPNLALVGLRIELEKRIRSLGEAAGIADERSMIRLFHRLRERGVLQEPSLSGVQELVSAGNQAAHGARVEPSVAAWAFDYGPQVLAALDARLSETKRTG